MSSQIDINKLSPEELELFADINKDPIAFGETFLIVPSDDHEPKPFRANYSQRAIMRAKKKTVYIACLSRDSQVIDPITLRPIPIYQAEHVRKTLCFDFYQNKLVWTNCTWSESGQKKCIKLNLGSGIDISPSEDHEVYERKKGWIRTDTLKIGDKILSPSVISIQGSLIRSDVILKECVERGLRNGTFDDEVFQYTDDCLSSFFLHLWESVGRLLHNETQISFMVHSRDLALELHHLLLRLEITCRIDEDGNVFIDEPIDLNFFLNTIGYDCPIHDAKSPRRWEIVTDIKRIGLRDVYDLSVEHEDHNFLASDIIVHNCSRRSGKSMCLTVLALWHAITKNNKKILFFANSSKQVDAWFEVLDGWIRSSEFVKSFQDPKGINRSSPQRRSFITNSYIAGYILTDQESCRGLTSDVCLPYKERVLTDIGYLPIGDIVEKGLGEKVLSYNPKTEQLEWKKILKRITNPLLDRQYNILETPFGELCCTEDHPIFTERGYIQANELLKGDIIYYDNTRNDFNCSGKTSSIRNNVGRRILCITHEREQECTIDNETWTEAKGLLRLEVQSVKQMVPQSTTLRGESRLRRNLPYCGEYVSSSIHRNNKPVLPKQEENNYKRNIRPIRSFRNSSMVHGRWFPFQIHFSTTYRGIFRTGEYLNSRIFNEKTKWPSYSETIQNVPQNRNSNGSQDSFNRNDKGISTRIYDVQDRYSISEDNKKMSILPERILPSSQCSRKDRTFLLSGMCYNKIQGIQERPGKSNQVEYKKKRIGKTEEVVYDLTIEDNHNFFAEGILISNCFVDEAQSLSDDDWSVLKPIMVGDMYRSAHIRNYLAGTIKEPTGQFYHRVKKQGGDEVTNLIFIPVTKNKDYTEEMIRAIRLEVSEAEFQTEFLLEVGTSEDSVFNSKDIQRAATDDMYYGKQNIKESSNFFRFMGVDWDKVQAGTNIAVVQYNKITQDMQVIYREEVEKGKFSYTAAVAKVIELYMHFAPDIVTADQGQGEKQWEDLVLESERRGLDLHNRLIKLPFQSKVEVPNMLTGEIERKLIKPLLVGILQSKLQESRLKFPAEDDVLKNQLLGYKIKKTTENTIKYSSSNEHIIDCLSFCAYGIWLCFENIMGQRYLERNADFQVIENETNKFTDERLLENFWSQLEGERSLGEGVDVFRSSFSMNGPGPMRSSW